MPDILHRLTVQAPRERVYDALVSQEGVRNWWTHDSDLEETVGGSGEFRFNGRRVITEVQIDELTFPARVVWTTVASNAPGGWTGSTISFDLIPEEQGTVVSFAHRGITEGGEGFARVNTGWAYYLFSLQHYLETGSGAPNAT